MDLRNKTTSEFRTVFHSPLGVPNSQVPPYTDQPSRCPVLHVLSSTPRRFFTGDKTYIAVTKSYVGNIVLHTCIGVTNCLWSWNRKGYIRHSVSSRSIVAQVLKISVSTEIIPSVLIDLLCVVKLW